MPLHPGIAVSGVPNGLCQQVGLPTQISQLLRPGKGVGIDGSMALESLAQIKYESASERCELANCLEDSHAPIEITLRVSDVYQRTYCCKAKLTHRELNR